MRSKTLKDKPDKLKHDRYDKDVIKIPGTGYYHIWAKTTKPKKKKTQDTEWHWMSTPSWWIRLFMTKPQRRAGSLWEREVAKTIASSELVGANFPASPKVCLTEEFEGMLESLDVPSVGHKPHKYYW